MMYGPFALGERLEENCCRDLEIPSSISFLLLFKNVPKQAYNRTTKIEQDWYVVGVGGCWVGEVRDCTTSSYPDHKDCKYNLFFN